MSSLRSLLTTMTFAVFRCELVLMALLGIAAFGVSLPSDLVVELEESTWPAETEDETQEGEEESLVQSPRRFELERQNSPGQARANVARCSRSLSWSLPRVTKAGHRLPNGLMAPPRC
jgi:hypothetical protein